ncbi:MAG TPA: VOC family protein [Hyphomonadaceae bacterium]|jgi:PhnB protein|nr:VOC family protein [Hyphomonadaceae bacterium]
MRVNANLSFDGTCEEAFKFYEKVLGGKIAAMFTYGGMPGSDHIPPHMKNRVMHVTLQVGDTVLMGSDAPMGHQKPQGFSVSVHSKTPDEADKVFAALSEGGVVIMPIAETAWTPRFGMLTDRFGTPWMINCDPAIP